MQYCTLTMKFVLALLFTTIIFYSCGLRPRIQPDKRTFCETDSVPGYPKDKLRRYYSCGFDSVRIRNGVPIVPDSLKLYRMGYDFIAWGDTLRRPVPGLSYMLILFDRLNDRHVRDFGRLYINDSLDLEFVFGNGRIDSLPADYFSSWTRNIRNDSSADLSRKSFDSIIRVVSGFHLLRQ